MEKNERRERWLLARTLFRHYHDFLSAADYAYVASDSYTSSSGSFLREMTLESRMSNNTPVVMVAPGFETVCQKFQCVSDSDEAQSPDSSNDSEVSQRISPYARGHLALLSELLQRNDSKPVSFNGLHIMQSPDSSWNDSGLLEMHDEEPWTNISEQKALTQAVHGKYGGSCSQIVISQDIAFLKSLRDFCRAGVLKNAPDDSLMLLSLNSQGYLYDPFEAEYEEEKLLARISRQKLTALVQRQPIFIDDSALRHPQACSMLQNIKPGLILSGKPLVVLANKQEPLALSDVLLERAQEDPPTVRFAWLRQAPTKTEAIIAALLSETSALPPNSKVSLITDRVVRAEKIQERLAGMGVFIEIYSVNKHGFLSNRDKKRASSREIKPSAFSSIRNRQAMEQAVKTDDLPEVLALASDKDALKNGVITCLCEKQISVLNLLLKHVDRIPSAIISWWILEYKQFQCPSFFLDNPELYDLLVQALSKCNFFVNQAEKWIDKLQELEEAPSAAKIELSFLVSLLRLAIDRAGVSGHTRIRRIDIPKDLPRTELSEIDLLRRKRQELLQRRDSLIRDLEKLSAERSDIERQIADLDAKMHI